MSLLNVVYTITSEDHRVLYVGRTSAKRWAGWEYCMGSCVRRRRSLHRMCEHMTGQDHSFRWCRLVDWEAGPLWSRSPVGGMVTHRYVIGDKRTDRVEQATIQEHRPRHNIALVARRVGAA